MKLAFLILAHRNPQQVARLCGALTSSESQIYIHLDRKCDAASFAEEIQTARLTEDVKFVDSRTPVNWGGYSMIQATLASIRQLLEETSSTPPDYVFLLSGQDYPIKSNSEIQAFMSANAGTEFISFAQMPAPFWSEKEMRRIREYQFFDYPWLLGAAYEAGTIARRKTLRFYTVTRLAKYLLPQRKFPAGLTPYSGSQWWALSRGCLEYVLDFLDRRPDVVKFFRWAGFPDEMVFQTVILNSDFASKASHEITNPVLSAPLCHLEWGHLDRPRTLTIDDWEALQASDKLFGRKFDMHEDAKILDLVDARRAE
ncbi:MAG: beta-1,6-N-acetylglucosaminyltransferase [Alphaproteobacteria bacterium]